MRLPGILAFLKPITPASWWAETPKQKHSEPPLPPQPMFPDDGRPNEAANAGAIGRSAVTSKTIKVFGKTIDRIAPAIEDVGPVQDGLASVLHDLFSNRGVLKDKDFVAHRDEASVRAAMEMPLVPDHPGGKLTVYRPGLGNTAAGPGQIAYLARHTDRLIIAHAHPGRGLRPAETIDGVPIPDELQGKVFEIGSPDPIMISWEQGSDLLLEQLDQISRSELMRGFDPREVGVTLIGHSQGGVDAARTRERLEEAGLDHIVRAVGTMNSPFGGSTVSNESMLGIATELGERALGLQAAGAVNRLDPHVLEKEFTPNKQRLVDAAVIGHTEQEGGERNIRWFFDITDEVLHRVSQLEDAAALRLRSLFQGNADRRNNDGMVSVESQSFGLKQVRLDFAVDHASVAEDPRAMKALLEAL